MLSKVAEGAPNDLLIKRHKFASYLSEDRDVPVILKAQVLDGVAPIDYVDEGLHIMRDIKQLLLRLKTVSTRSPKKGLGIHDASSGNSYRIDSSPQVKLPKISRKAMAHHKGSPIGSVSLMSESIAA